MVIPVFVKVIIKSLCAKARFYYNSVDQDKCSLQWIGKPILRIGLEPRLGVDFELKEFSPMIQKRLEDFIAN